MDRDPKYSGPKPAGFMPYFAGQVVRTGVTGAAVTAGLTAFSEGMRVRAGEITTEEAIQTTVQSSAIGAGAGAGA